MKVSNSAPSTSMAQIVKMISPPTCESRAIVCGVWLTESDDSSGPLNSSKPPTSSAITASLSATICQRKRRTSVEPPARSTSGTKRGRLRSMPRSAYSPMVLAMVLIRATRP